MKLILTEHERTVTIEEDTGGSIQEAVAIVADALMGLSYHPDSIVSGFESYLEEHKNENC